MSAAFARAQAGGTVLTVRAQPGARRSEIVGVHGDALKIKIAAPPEDGKANAELCDFLARALGVVKNSVSVISGTGSRSKRVLIESLEPDLAIAKLLGESK